jgi:hypothetical protein
MAVAQLRPLRICRALPLTEDSPPRDEIPQLAHNFLIENRGPLCAGRDVFAARAPAKKRPQLREKRPRRRCNTDPLNAMDEAACCACVFHSTPQLASPQQRLIAGALYSQFFKRSFKPHLSLMRSRYFRSESDLWFLIWRSQIICCLSKRAESHRNKTIARPVS